MPPKLNLACQTSSLSELRSFLQQNLANYTLSEVERHQLTLAVEEVCANLIIHSHACNPKDKIQLEIKDSNEKVIFEITDEGIAFNLLEYEVPQIKQVVEEKRKGGCAGEGK